MTHASALDALDALEDGSIGHAELLDEESLTVEVARHPAGQPDPRNPHTEDELYYVIAGSGKIRVGDSVHSVERGDTVFVEQGLEHDFFDIEEELVTLIVFAGSSDPASYSIRE
jgi:mannose-6-phosphate isomerase-like protein (cupin superfamily)